MYKGKKILAVIPARGGSKGVQLKNIINVGGRPLIHYSIQCAKGSKYIDRTVISTDDFFDTFDTESQTDNQSNSNQTHERCSTFDEFNFDFFPLYHA